MEIEHHFEEGDKHIFTATGLSLGGGALRSQCTVLRFRLGSAFDPTLTTR